MGLLHTVLETGRRVMGLIGGLMNRESARAPGWEKAEAIQEAGLGVEEFTEPSVSLLRAARYTFLFLAAAFLAWEGLEAVRESGGLTTFHVVEILGISFLGSSLVWITAKRGEALARDASRRHGEVMAAHRALQVEAAERKRAEEAKSQHVERLQRMSQGLLSTSVLPPSHAMAQLLDMLVEVTGVAEAYFFRYEEGSELLTLDSFNAPVPGLEQMSHEVQEFHLDRDDGLVGLVGSTRRAVYVPECSREPGCQPVRPGTESAYLLPVSFGERLYGVMRLVSPDAGGIPEQARSMADTVAAYTGAALENARLIESERAHSQEVRTLLNIASILVQPRSFEERYRGVMEEVLRVSQGDRATLRVPYELEKGLRLVTVVGEGPGHLSPALRPYGLDSSLSELAFQRGEPVVANDYVSHPQATPSLIELGVKSAVSLPIKAQDRLMGVFTVTALKANHFTQRRVRLLEAIADGMGALLENARLLEEVHTTLEDNRRRVEALRQVAGEVAIQAVPEESLHQMVSLSRDMVGALYGAIAVWGPGGSVSKFIVSWLSPEQQQRAWQSPSAQGILDTVRNASRSVRLADISTDPRATGFPSPQSSIKTLLAVPIMIRGGNLGAIMLGEKEDGAEFTVDDERLLGLFAVQAGVFLDNLNLHSEVLRERSTLSAIQASMMDGLAVMDAGGRILYCNRSASTLVGMDVDEVLGKPIEEIVRQRWDDFETLEERSAAALMDAIGGREKAPATFGVKMLRPQQRDLLLTMFPIPLELGETMMGVLIRDVGAESEAARSRDSLAAADSREPNQPMKSLIGFAEVLLRREAPMPNEGSDGMPH